jgi:hypothetical protein
MSELRCAQISRSSKHWHEVKLPFVSFMFYSIKPLIKADDCLAVYHVMTMFVEPGILLTHAGAN